MTSMPDAYTASTTSRLSKPAGPIPPAKLGATESARQVAKR